MTIRDDGITESSGYSPFDDPTRMGGVADVPPPKEDKKSNRLDNAENKRRLKKLLEWKEQELERQAHNRYQMALDQDYYDSLQWTEEEAMEIANRGQAPLVYNEIKPAIDWMIGTERRTRIDYKVLPRRKEGNDDAEVKSKLLKYLSDTNKAPYSRSEAFEKAVKAGLGWIEVGIRGDETEEPVFYRAEDWRNILYDSNGTRKDLTDSRYLFRWKYLDTDIAEAFFPDRTHLIRKSAVDGNMLTVGEQEEDIWYMGARVTEPGQDYVAAATGKYRPYDGSAFSFSRRSRVKVFEAWYTEPVTKKYMKGGDYDGDAYDEENNEHKEAYKNGDCSLYDKRALEMRVAIFVEDGLLFEGKSPYKHGKFPFIPVWAYRRGRDNAPYSPIRSMRDPQDSLNKRNSKAQWILASNQVDYEEGAFEDVEEAREEVSRPDMMLARKKGFEVNVKRDVALAHEHVMLMESDKNYIHSGGGITAENLGRETNATSGKAIIARQDQGGTTTTEIFDNLRLAAQLAGEIELSLVEQYYTEEKTVRIVGDRGNASFVEINKYDEETDEILNDITANHADFVVSEQDYRDSLRIAMFESLFDIVGRLAQVQPQIALNLMDLVVEMADVPNRDELVARIRKINGQRDPESDPTEEELMAERQQAKFMEMQQKLAIAKVQAELKEIVSKGEANDAKALMDRIEAMYSALQAAQVVATIPEAAPVADEIMTSAGFVDKEVEQLAQSINQTAGQMQQPASPAEGVRQGIETMRNDGVR